MRGSRPKKPRDSAKIKIDGHADLYEYKKLYARARRDTPEYKAYIKEYNKKYREANKEKIAERNRAYKQEPDVKARCNYANRKRALALKIEVFTYYSNGEPKCAVCGFDDIRALDLDHINNDGAEQRKALCGGRSRAGTSFYTKVRQMGFPDDLQVLCKNCNWIKEMDRRYGESSELEIPELNPARQVKQRTPYGWAARGGKCQK